MQVEIRQTLIVENTACSSFTFILMVCQMLFISHGVVPNMGLTPHKEATFLREALRLLVRSQSKF